RVLKPWPEMAEWWTKQSFCPSSGVMKPKPLVSLNHLTVPVVRICELLCCCESEYGRAERTDYNCLSLAVDPHGRGSRGALSRECPDSRKGLASPDPREPSERVACIVHTWHTCHTTGFAQRWQAKNIRTPG